MARRAIHAFIMTLALSGVNGCGSLWQPDVGPNVGWDAFWMQDHSPHLKAEESPACAITPNPASQPTAP